jgi:hypothetical protein
MDTKEEVPENEIVDSVVDTQRTLSILASYIEKHPEDAEKWLNFYKDGPNIPSKWERRRSRAGDLETDVCLKMYPGDRLDIEFTGDNMCPHCKRTWESTVSHPTTTLFCGHLVHTMCWILSEYYYDDESRCGYPGCNLSTSHIASMVCRYLAKSVNKPNEVFLDAIVNREEFKSDLKLLKKRIATFNKHNSAFLINAKKIKNDLLEKHKYNLAQLQNDMNASVISVREDKNYIECRKALRQYRKVAADIFNKHHLSLRELKQRKLIKTNWRTTYILERHGRLYGSYRLGVRIYPGKKKWEHIGSNAGGGEDDEDAEDSEDIEE